MWVSKPIHCIPIAKLMTNYDIEGTVATLWVSKPIHCIPIVKSMTNYEIERTEQ